MPLIRVALDVPLDKLFDYLAPDATIDDVGRRVLVEFGRKKRVGVICTLPETPDVGLEQLKHADSVDRSSPPLHPTSLALFRFCSRYYHYPLGPIVVNALPPRLRRAQHFHQRRPSSHYQLTEAGRDATSESLPGRARVMRAVLSELRAKGWLSLRELRAIAPSAAAAMREFLARGWVELTNAVGPAVEPVATAALAFTLNEEQRLAVTALEAASDRFGVWLLYGITGSGKTEVYMQLVARLLQRQRQALILVPEISLTPQLEAHFAARFPGEVQVSLHSGLAEQERAQRWSAVQSGAARIVLGTRLAVFTPLPSLGMVIVDEEQDSSFKQQDGLRYSARDLAVFLARQANVPVVLGSATPSLESYYHALSGRYRLLTLTRRARTNAELAPIAFIDTREQKLHDGLSEELCAAVSQRLARAEQCLVFINRRGFAPVLYCAQCGWFANCTRCREAHRGQHRADRRVRVVAVASYPARHACQDLARCSSE